MVALAQASAAAYIRVPTLVLTDEHIHRQLARTRDGEGAGEGLIGLHHIPGGQFVHRAPQQHGLAAVLAVARAARPLRHGAAGQRDDLDQARPRKAQSRLCGKARWLESASGIDTVVPSISLTGMPRHSHGVGCSAHSRAAILAFHAARLPSPKLRQVPAKSFR